MAGAVPSLWCVHDPDASSCLPPPPLFITSFLFLMLELNPLKLLSHEVWFCRLLDMGPRQDEGRNVSWARHPHGQGTE